MASGPGGLEYKGGCWCSLRDNTKSAFVRLLFASRMVVRRAAHTKVGSASRGAGVGVGVPSKPARERSAVQIRNGVCHMGC
jgi:hypothetical protein